MSTQMYNAKASKARREARREAGTCVSCGKEKQRGGVSPYNGKVYQTCQSCYDVATRNKRKYRGGNAVPGPDAPVTTTGKHYLVPSVNLIGKIMPCNCDDPIILQFADGSLDFFWLKENAPLLSCPLHRQRRLKLVRRASKKQPSKSLSLSTLF